MGPGGDEPTETPTGDMEVQPDGQQATREVAEQATPSSNQDDDDPSQCQIPLFQLGAIRHSESAESCHGDFSGD